MKNQYDNGTRANPVRCHDWSEAFDVACERDRPTVVAVLGTNGMWALANVFPSRNYKILQHGLTISELHYWCRTR